jgi:hypothetical protein
MMTDLIKDNVITIVICVYIFLTGVGIGAAITDMINRRGNSDKNTVHKSENGHIQG